MTDAMLESELEAELEKAFDRIAEFEILVIAWRNFAVLAEAWGSLTDSQEVFLKKLRERTSQLLGEEEQSA